MCQPLNYRMTQFLYSTNGIQRKRPRLRSSRRLLFSPPGLHCPSNLNNTVQLKILELREVLLSLLVSLSLNLKPVTKCGPMGIRSCQSENCSLLLQQYPPLKVTRYYQRKQSFNLTCHPIPRMANPMAT